MPKSSGTVKTNPNAFGGAFGYDGRTGLGIGSLGGDPNSGIGRNWNMGDALSSPKSEFDVPTQEVQEKLTKDTTVRELAIFAGLIDNTESFDDIDASIEKKAFSSTNQTPTDSLAHKGTDISSLGGLGNSIASVIGMSESYLVSYIKEQLLEYKGSSGRLAVMSSPNIGKNLGGKNKNDPLPVDDASASTNTGNPGPEGASNDLGLNSISTSAINSKGVGQRRITVKLGKEKYDLHPTTDGGEAVFDSDLKIDIGDDETTYQNLERTSSKNYIDNQVVNKQIYKKLKLTNI